MSNKEQKFEIVQVEDIITKKFLVREIKFRVKIKQKKILDLFEGNTILKHIFDKICRRVNENTTLAAAALMKPRKFQITFFHIDLKKPIINSNLNIEDLNSKLLFKMVRFNENGQRLDMQNFRSQFEILFTIFNEPLEVKSFIANINNSLSLY